MVLQIKNYISPGVVGDERGVAVASRTAAYRVVNDAHAAERRFLPLQPDGRGAVSTSFNNARGQRGRVVQGSNCKT